MQKQLFTIVFCLLSICAFSQHGQGLLFDDEAYDKVPLKARNVGFADDIATIPSASLRPYIPSIKSQGQMGTCVGWSTTYYGRSILQARMENITDKAKIDELVYSPYFTYLNSNDTKDVDCQDGAYIHLALDFMSKKGAPEFNYLNSCTENIPQHVWDAALKHKIKGYTRLFSSNEPKNVKLESVKRSLVNGNPVIIGFHVEQAFHYTDELYVPQNGEIKGGHAMCVVGYDDNKYGGAFEIVNSWGEDWGNKGFVWVRYDDFINYAKYAYEMIPEIITKQKELSGYVVMELGNGKQMEVKKGSGNYSKTVVGWQEVVDEDEQSIGDFSTIETYEEGTRYRMRVKINKPSYVYVFAADSDQKNSILFPSTPFYSPHIMYPESEVIIPGQKQMFQLGGQVSSDYSVVVFSEDELDSGEILDQLNEMKGKLIDKLYVIFKDKLIPKENVKLSTNKAGFDATYTKGSVMMMVIDIRRK